MSASFVPPGDKPFEKHCYVVVNDRDDAHEPGVCVEL